MRLPFTDHFQKSWFELSQSERPAVTPYSSLTATETLISSWKWRIPAYRRKWEWFLDGVGLHPRAAPLPARGNALALRRRLLRRRATGFRGLRAEGQRLTWYTWKFLILLEVTKVLKVMDSRVPPTKGGLDQWTPKPSGSRECSWFTFSFS